MENTIAVKVGSILLTKKTGVIRLFFIWKLCRQISKLKKMGHKILLVTSGSIACDQNSKRSKNLRSAIGQAKLIGWYRLFFKWHKLEVAQFLPTYHDIEGGNVFKEKLQEAFDDPSVISIINYNDPMSDHEVKAYCKYSDNDVLLEKICDLIPIQIAVIGFGEEAFLNDKKNPIYRIKISDQEKNISCIKKGNGLGYGEDGMETKYKVLCNLAAKGICAILAPGRKRNFLIRAVKREKNFGTTYCQ